MLCGRSQACVGPRLEEPGLRRRGECGARCGSGGGWSAARPQRAAGLSPRAARGWGPDVAAEPGPGAVRRGGCVAARGVCVWKSRAGWEAPPWVWATGDVGPGLKGPRERGERQPGDCAVRGRKGAPRPSRRGGGGRHGGLASFFGWALTRSCEETEPCGSGRPCWRGRRGGCVCGRRLWGGIGWMSRGDLGICCGRDGCWWG